MHVDDYKLDIYNSLRVRSEARFITSLHLTQESPALTGYLCGNSPQAGFLTSNPNVRLHCCEKGNMCAVASKPGVVTIRPVVATLPSGGFLAEVGIGGGGGDLEREAELDLTLADLRSALGE